MRALLLRVGPIALVVVAACHDSTGPKNAPGVTAQGVVIAARASRSSFGRADTVWATAVLRNPTAAPVTLLLSTPTIFSGTSPHVAGIWLGPGQDVSMASFSSGYISGLGLGWPTLVVPAHDSLTYAFPWSVADNATAPTGTYTFRAAIYPVDTLVGRVTTVTSNSVTATLHD